MLENLNRVRWRWASHAYGSARDVPKMLRGLASEDESVRIDAMDQLHATIFHQGNRYDSTALAVPFLFELALDPATRDRRDLVLLLVALAFGDESNFLPCSVTRDELPQHWNDWERSVYDAVAERIASLAPLLREADESLRVAAAYALAWFPRAGANAIGDVRRAYDASTDEEARATLLIALAMLSRDDPNKNDLVSLLNRVHAGDGSANVRASAAAGLTLLGAVDDDVVKTISAALIDGSTRRTEMLWNDGDFVGYLASVLPFAAAGREEEVATTLIDGLSHAQPYTKYAITRALLAVVVPSNDYRALSALQLRALRAIDEHGEWDRSGGVLVNFPLTSDRYRLPSERDDFHAFVQAADASARGETVEWKPRERPAAPKRVEQHSTLSLVLSSIFLLLGLLFIAIDRHFLPGFPREWKLPLALAMVVVSASMFFVGRRKSPRVP